MNSFSTVFAQMCKAIVFKLFGLYLSRVNPLDLEKIKIEIFTKILTNSGGDLHIGANSGDERNFYQDHNLKVIWIEADPDIYQILLTNISDCKNQIAFQGLLLDTPGEKYEFFRFNNDGYSNSIFKLGTLSGYEKSGLEIIGSVLLQSLTLDEMFSDSFLEDYPHWVIDIQGSEMLMLAGSTRNLQYCHSIKIEVSTREVYKGGATFDGINEFLQNHGFYCLFSPPKEFHGDILFLKHKSLNF
jgi:FkbM family methyltransferase